MKPLISVIVPIYKVEKYLTICVDSLLRQSYGNLEIIKNNVKLANSNIHLR